MDDFLGLHSICPLLTKKVLWEISSAFVQMCVPNPRHFTCLNRQSDPSMHHAYSPLETCWSARLQYAPFKLTAQNQYLTALSSWSYVSFHWLYYDHFQFIMVSGSTANINPCNYSNCDFFACQGADKVSNDSTRILGWRSFGNPFPKQKPVELRAVTDPISIYSISSIDGKHLDVHVTWLQWFFDGI